MTTKSVNYDHAAYVTRLPINETGPNVANTSFPGVNMFTAQLGLSATFTVVTAGTSAAGNLWVINKVSGTATTALATATIGTSTAGAVVNIPLSATAGGVALAQGDVLVAVKGTDATSVNYLVYEVALQPLANITA